MNTIIEQYRKQLLQLAIYQDDTATNYISCIYKYVEFANNHLNIEPFKTTPQHLKQWMMHLKKNHVSNSRMTHHKSALTGFFTFLMNMNLIDHNPTDCLFPIRRSKSELNQPIDVDTAYQLLKSIDRTNWIGQRNFMIISFLWALGLRRAELTNLRVKDFDPHYDPQNKIGLLIVHGKGRKQRALFIVDKLYDKLINYLARPVSPTHLNKKCHPKYRPIFPSRYGATLTGDHVLKIVHQAAQTAGIKGRITPHVLRHSFATEMYLQRVPLNDIQDVMGHETEAETAIYIHVPEKLKKQALKIITIEGEFSWPYMYGGTSRLSW
jgi:site-specific recombinase XerD